MQRNGVPARLTGQHFQASADTVIIGNGIAGLTAAVEARRFAPNKQIIMITEQCHPTINTPALKQFAVGKIERGQLLAYPIGTEQAMGIQVLQARVDAIDGYERFVRFAGGHGRVYYDSLLLATGTKAAGLGSQVPGRQFDGVLVLHRLKDYLDLRRRLKEVREVLVIGGGIHAVESVMSMLQAGKRVSWLLRGKTCISHIFNQAASDLLLAYVEQAGARVYLETEVAGIVGSIGAVAGVVTNQNQLLSCQLVLVCTGTKPATTLAEHCNLPLIHEPGRGILVDDELRTSVPSIYAAGDVAALKNPQTGVHHARAQWYAAVVQGHTVAATMTGQPVSSLHAALGVSWHAARLGVLSLLSVGSPQGGIEKTTVLSDSSRGGYRMLAIAGDRLSGYLSLGPTQPAGLAIKRLIDEGLSIRGALEPLLKGTFDGHEYFPPTRSSSDYPVATRGSSTVKPERATPPVRISEPEQPVTAAERPLSIVAPAPAARPRHNTEPLTFPARSREERIARKTAQAGPIREPIPLATGMFPATAGASRGENEDASRDEPATVSPLFTALPASRRSIRSRSLWSYDQHRDQLPG